MDTRTLAVLCMSDLVQMIEAGDFMRFGEAERMVDELAGSFPGDYARSAALSDLQDRLARYQAPERPECDALLRAVRAVARWHHAQCFERAWLTPQAAGA